MPTGFMYDPAKQARDPRFCVLCQGNCMCQAGPGGNTTLIENDEKGILETGLQELISYHKQAALGSDHDSYRQGIYSTNSMGDND